MIKNSTNKMQVSDTDKSLNDFFYPEYGITIKAISQDEADSKLQELIKNKDISK